MDRNSALAEAASILQKTNFSKADSSRVTSLLEFSDRLTNKDELRKSVMRQRDAELGLAPTTPEPTPADQEFRNYLTAIDSAIVKEMEKRAGMNVGTGSAGGYLAPAGFAQRVESAMVGYDQIFDACTTFTTQRGGAFYYPLVDDVSFATVVPEGTTSDTSADVVFGGIQFPKIQAWRSGFVPVSWELLVDSFFDVEGLLAATFGKRLARGIGQYLVGVLHASAPIGVTAASATVVTANEIIDLLDAVDPDFQPGAAFVLSQRTLNALHKMVTTGGAYVFPPQQDAAGRQLLLGRKVYVSPSMGLLAAVGYPIAYGDFSKFVRREVAGSVAIKAFPERNAEHGQNTFESYLRCDGAILQTATAAPIQLLSMQGGS